MQIPVEVAIHLQARIKTLTEELKRERNKGYEMRMALEKQNRYIMNMEKNLRELEEYASENGIDV